MSSNKKEWDKAIEKELEDLRSQQTWILTGLPSGRKALKGRWVYKTKLTKEGNIDKFKARWVVKGFLQKYGIDYTETFANTVKPMAYRLLFALATYLDLEIQQWDIKSAFPNAPLDEEIYVIQPTGFEDKLFPQKVCKLQKALYGLKQSARQWYKHLCQLLGKLGFKPITSDQAIFVNLQKQMIVTSHIDDLLIFAKDINIIQELKSNLSKEVDISDLGSISYYLGIEVNRNRKEKELVMSQTKFLRELLKKFGKEDLKPSKIPCIVNLRLDKHEGQASEQHINLYQQQVGSLMYLMTNTRSDITFAVNQCARYMSNPGPDHFKSLNYIWKYLLNSINYELVFNNKEKPILQGFADADWGGDYPTRKSTTGYVFTFGNTTTSWASKLQKTVALSSCEAEYMALKDAIKEYFWLNYIFDQIVMLSDFKSENILFTDSQSAIALAKNPEHHSRTKHIDIQYHFVRESIQDGKILLKYLPTDMQVADGLTKPLSPPKHKEFVERLGLRNKL